MAKGLSALRYSSGTAPDGTTGCICPDKLYHRYTQQSFKVLNVAYEIFVWRYRHGCGSNINTSGLHLPEALYSGVLHD